MILGRLVGTQTDGGSHNVTRSKGGKGVVVFATSDALVHNTTAVPIRVRPLVVPDGCVQIARAHTPAETYVAANGWNIVGICGGGGAGGGSSIAIGLGCQRCFQGFLQLRSEACIGG